MNDLLLLIAAIPMAFIVTMFIILLIISRTDKIKARRLHAKRALAMGLLSYCVSLFSMSPSKPVFALAAIGLIVYAFASYQLLTSILFEEIRPFLVSRKRYAEMLRIQDTVESWNRHQRSRLRKK